MSVTVELRDTERVVVVEGDLARPATLVQLHASLTQVSVLGSTPVVVDLSAATGESAGISRLLSRTSRLMSRRGVQFDVVNRGLADVYGCYAAID